jgi:hypothetical protein
MFRAFVNSIKIFLKGCLLDGMFSFLDQLPESYVSAAFGISGGGRNNAKGERDSGLMADDGFLPYDEWDYRRQGYRKTGAA